MKSVLDRFLKYVSIDTQSAYDAVKVPSTEKQKNLSRVLVEELKELGAKDACMTHDANVYATFPANCEKKQALSIGFSAHVDTTPEQIGANVKARIVKNYDGKDIVLNPEKNIVMRVNQFPFMKDYVGEDLIVTDGTTLLGADDKAGIAEIMGMLQYFHDHPEVKHGEIQVFMPSDEEIGNCGAKLVDKVKFHPEFAYTLDGGKIGEIIYECFNASTARIKIYGLNIHPGLAKNQMKNAILIGKEFMDMLPDAESPSHTEKYEGYYHVLNFHGEVELTTMTLYIRDHDMVKFKMREERIRNIASYLNSVYGENTVECEITETYQNMAEGIRPCYEIVEAVEKAMVKEGVKPFTIPIRGGTDGSVLTAMGIPCPNISTGQRNCHGIYEFISIQSMEKVPRILVNIVEGFVH